MAVRIEGVMEDEWKEVRRDGRLGNERGRFRVVDEQMD